MKVSIVIPVLNDAPALKHLLKFLKDYEVEVIVVDGGSGDEPERIADEYGAQFIFSDPGRARQMNRGAREATGDVLLFLHADSQPPQFFDSLIKGGMRNNRFMWGRFDVRLSGRNPMFRVIGWMMNLRALITGICTGDQGLFVRADYFTRMGGFADIPLMEDIEFCKRSFHKPYCIRHKLTTSSRRWEQQGILKTIFLMWSLRLRYFLGASPESLAKRYYG